MLRHRNIDRICCAVMAAAVLLSCVYAGTAASGAIGLSSGMDYEARLFDKSFVHTIDIVMEDWDGFLETCTDEEYVSCSVVIDGEAYAGVGLRAKGNTSLSSVKSYGNNRYSFKIEFDHYQSGRTYHGLDKLSLNNLIQDSTLMKDYLAYTLMGMNGAASPLCAYAQVSVNGEAWGLYLAVEAVEDSFLTRNYGREHGELYKPDSMDMGGGRGNGREFDMDEFRGQLETQDQEGMTLPEGMTMPEGMTFPGMDMGGAERGLRGTDSDEPAEGDEASGSDSSGRDRSGDRATGMGGGRGSSDVMLQYTNDDPESYENIFSSAKTDVTEADQARLIEALRTLSEGENPVSAVDAEAVIRYLVVHDFMGNGDSYTGSMIHNYYLYEEDGRLSMLPWDYNLALGAFGMSGGAGATSAVNSPIDTPVSSGTIESRPIIAWIFESEAYTQRYHEVYAEFVSMMQEEDWLVGEIRRVGDMIAPYAEQDTNAFCTYEEFLNGAETAEEYCALRLRSIQGQLDGSIPSTVEGQAADDSSLIDASHILISDMGSMGGGGKNGSDRGNAGFPAGQGGMGFAGRRMGSDDRKTDGGMAEDTRRSAGSESSETVDGAAEGSTENGDLATTGGTSGGAKRSAGSESSETVDGAAEGMERNAGNAAAESTGFAGAGREKADSDKAETAESETGKTSARSSGTGRDFSGKTGGADPWRSVALSAAMLAVGILLAKGFKTGR